MDKQLQKEQAMLQSFEEADKEDKSKDENDYFKRKNGGRAFEQPESLSDVSTAIIKKANKSFFKGLIPSLDFGI